MIPKEDITFLPAHILDTIGDGFETKELINLLSTAPEAAQLLKNSFRIVTDLIEESYKLITSDIYTTIDIATQSHSSEWFSFKGILLLEVHDIRTSWVQFYSLINSLSKHTTCAITIYNTDIIPAEFQESIEHLVNAAYTEPGFIKSLHFPDLDYLTLRAVIMNFSLIKAPKITYLGLRGVRIAGLDTTKVDFPNLKQITLEAFLISEDGGDLKRLLQTPQTLLLENMEEPLELKGLRSSKIDFLKFNNNSMGKVTLEDIDLPNLKYLELIDTNIVKLSNLKIDNALTLQVLASSFPDTIEFNNIQANSLQQMEIVAPAISGFENVQLPDTIPSAVIIVQDQPVPNIKPIKKPVGEPEKKQKSRFSFLGKKEPKEVPEVNSPNTSKNPFTFLEKVEFLEIDNSLQILENLCLKKLKVLALPNEFDYKVTKNTKFPNLEKLLINHNDSIQQVPFFNAPKLEYFRILGSFNFISVNNIPTDYPQLKQLVIDNCSISVISGLNFPNLEFIDIQADTDDFIFTNNELPALKSCVITPKVQADAPLQRLKFENNNAPKLEELTLLKPLVDQPITTKPYPFLKALTVCAIQELEVVSSSVLEILDIQDTIQMKSLKLGQLDNLKVFYPPRVIDDKTLKFINNLNAKLSAEADVVAKGFDNLAI